MLLYCADFLDDAVLLTSPGIRVHGELSFSSQTTMDVKTTTCATLRHSRGDGSQKAAC